MSLRNHTAHFPETNNVQQATALLLTVKKAGTGDAI